MGSGFFQTPAFYTNLFYYRVGKTEISNRSRYRLCNSTTVVIALLKKVGAKTTPAPTRACDRDIIRKT
jgi:hypothetical protein